MIPPLGGGDFQGIAGLSSDDSLLVGVNSARAKFYEGPRAVKHRLDEPGQIIPQHGCVPPLPASVSPGSGNFSSKINEGCQGQLRTKRLSSLTGGWKSRNSTPLPVLGEIFFLTFPFIDQDLSPADNHLGECKSSLRSTGDRLFAVFLWSRTTTHNWNRSRLAEQIVVGDRFGSDGEQH